MAFDQDQFAFIVEQLAEGEAPDAIVLEYGRRYGAAIKTQDLAGFRRDKLPADWVPYFDLCRAAFKAGAPAADQAFRIALLDKWARQAGSRGALELAAKHLELIEKIQSGFFAGKAKGDAPTGNQPAEITEIVETIIDPSEPKPAPVLRVVQ